MHDAAEHLRGLTVAAEARGRNALLCIIPPHMLKSMCANGTPVQKQIALASIVGSAQLRGQRHAALKLASLRTLVPAGGKRRRVYTAENGSSLPGRLLLEEGGAAPEDPAVNEAYEGAGATYDLFWAAYQRDSLDGNGMRLDSTVHYRQSYDNAFWDGNQMVYGDGDGQLFNRFTLAVDVIGHELTHGVTQFTSNLSYSDQPGALNESLSDVFGSLVKQRQLNQSASEADWLIGEGLFTKNVKGTALRSLKAPGTAYDDPVLGRDPQPAHMRDYVQTTDDDGGVHINSGIPNHAFFLMAAAMAGSAWEKAGRIWYLAARDKFTSSTNFQSAATLTYETAVELYGAGSVESKAVQYGWEGVGLTVGDQKQKNGAQKPNGCGAAAPAFVRSLLARLTPGS
jgi:Zn-dependent metalloprotease